MIIVEVSKSGVDLQKLAEQTPKVVAAATQKISDFALKRAVDLTPIVTGLMARSWYLVKRGDLEYEISNRAPYFLFYIEGTAPHEIRPRFASVLRFKAGGSVVFTKLVNHPGTRPHGLLQFVSEQTSGEIPKLMSEAFEESEDYEAKQ